MLSSTSNPRIRHVQKLLAERSARRAAGQYVIEGPRLVLEALAAPVSLAELFVTEAFLDTAAGVTVRAAENLTVTIVSERVLAALSETVTPQGVVAVAPLPVSQPLATASLRLVLDGVKDPGNVGTLLRSALAAGVDQLVLTAGCADAYSPKVVRAGMGAHFHLPIHSDVTPAALETLLAGTPVVVADADGSLTYDEWDWTRPVTLVVGGETTGPSELVHRLGCQTLAIPMSPRSESLNVAMAGSVMLFEAARQKRRIANPSSGP